MRVDEGGERTSSCWWEWNGDLTELVDGPFIA